MDSAYIQTLLVLGGVAITAVIIIAIDIAMGDGKWLESQLDETDKLASLGKALEPYGRTNRWTEFDDHAVEAMTLGNDVAPFEPRPADLKPFKRDE